MYPRTTALVALFAAIGLGLAPGCDPLVMSLDDDPLPTSATFELQPTAVDFGEVAAGAPRGQGLRLFNHGTRPFRILDVELIGDDSWQLVERWLGEEIEPGRSRPLEVWFDPEIDGPHTAALVITTDVAGQQQAVLTADGLAPRLVIEPPVLQFDGVAVGCAATQQLSIRNAGSQPLTVTGLELLRKSDELSLTSEPALPAVVLPGESTWLEVAYHPEDDAVDLGSVAVFTDAPDDPGGVVPIDAAAAYPEPVQEEFVQRGNLQADVLWVVDDGPAMEPAQQAAGLAAWSYVADLAELVDFQLGVVSTRDPALRGDLPVLTAGTTDAAVHFAGALQVGTVEGEPAAGLATALAAVTPPMTSPDGPNFGFVRDDALLYVVVLSSRDDASAGEALEPVLAMLEARPDPERVVISGIAAFPQCAETPTMRYHDAVIYTGGVEVCLQELVASPLEAVQALADDAARVRDTFALAGEPLDGIQAVTVDGEVLLAGWSHDPESNAIRFELGHVPDNGQLVAVRYHPALCE